MKTRKISVWIGVLLSLCCLGCGSAAPRETPLTVSPNYTGLLRVDEKDESTVTLLLEQKGSEITGRFKIQSIGSEYPAFGTVEGTAKKEEVELALRIPLGLAIKQGVPNLISMTLSGRPLDQAESEKLLKRYRAEPQTSPSGRTLWTGKAEIARGDDRQAAEVELLDAPVPGNPFNLQN